MLPSPSHKKRKKSAEGLSAHPKTQVKKDENVKPPREQNKQGHKKPKHDSNPSRDSGARGKKNTLKKGKAPPSEGGSRGATPTPRAPTTLVQASRPLTFAEKESRARKEFLTRAVEFLALFPSKVDLCQGQESLWEFYFGVVGLAQEKGLLVG